MRRIPGPITVVLPMLLAWGATGMTPLAGAAEPPRSSRPNIIVILADDLGASELGCYGHAEHRTPHLDRLAETGVKFETAFTAPVCHPTRFMLLTGQYGCHNGVYNFPEKRGGPDEKNQGADDIANHVTWAQLLREAGYKVAVSGKWQLSGEYPTIFREAGFDEHCAWATRASLSEDDARRAQEAGIDYRSRYWRPSIVRNGRWVPTSPDDYGPDIFNEFVIDFARRHRDEPFAVYYPMALVHGPWHSTPHSTKTPADRDVKDRAHFKANVEYMDFLVGKLVRALEDLGLREETVLVFTGDNGSGGDGKSDPTERGARVPLIVNAPGLVRTRGSTMALSDMSDILPTVVELAGARLPTDRPIDGHSLSPFLRGESERTRDWIFAFQADRRILRTDRWLLEDNSPLHPGRLYDCGDRRDGTGYRDVTDDESPEVAAARRRFDELLSRLPAPILPSEGAPNETKDRKGREKEKGRRGRTRGEVKDQSRNN